MKRFSFLSLLFLLIFLVSCSKENKIAKTLPGFWNVDKVDFYSVTNPNESFSATNAGTIDFKNDGTGKNSYTYSVGGEDYNNNETFKWENTDENVTIEGSSSTGVKQRVFTIDDFEKDTQVWTNIETDNDSLVYTLTRQE